VSTDALYCRNMEALFRVDPRLAQRIDECSLDPSVLVEPSRRGPATVRVSPSSHGHEDRPAPSHFVYLHSRVDPEDEARRFAEAVEVGDTFCYIVGGFGLGHHVRALHARLKGDAFLVVAEPNLALLKAAMESVDLAGVFKDDKCVILTSLDKGELHTRLESRTSLIMMGTQFVPHPPSDRVAGEFQAAIRKLMADHLTYCRMSIVTLVSNSRMTCRNVANNLPRYLSTPPIDMLRDRFKGYPGIVVSAGPSLRRNIDQLARLKGRAVICSVQTTLKMLLDRGIEPDFVTSLDYHELSKRFFEGLPAGCRTHLIAEPKVNWQVTDAYPGPTSLLDNRWARLCVGDALAARAGLKAGSTVAHLAFYLTLYLGCDPIILVGQDLAYTDHVYYTPGTSMHDLWRPELNRFNTIEMREWERIVRNRSISRKVTDIHGQKIYTDEQLFTYLQQFEGDFALVPDRVIDATEGGVRKAGTRLMSLKQVTDDYCREPIPTQRFAYLDELNWDDPSKLEAAERELEKRLEDADHVADICEKMLVILRDMETLVDRPDQFNRRIVEVDKLRVRIREQHRVYEMISSLSQRAELQRYTADRRLELEETSETQRARRQLKRDIEFVEGIAEGTEALREILRGSIERFQAFKTASVASA
jgi:hypothetical protein